MSYSFLKLSRLLARKKDSHKGENGKVLVIGGSRDLVGAPILASVSALRSGADIVTCCCPESVATSLTSYCPDIMTLRVTGNYFTPKHIPLIVSVLKKYDVILIGNGIGVHSQTKAFVTKLLLHSSIKKMKKVIDADALKMISLKEVSNSILLPHAYEYQTLLSNSGISQTGYKELMLNLDSNVLVKKGPIDCIFSSKKIIKNTTGNPGLSKAGTGDVLAGVCAALYAKIGNPLESAHASAWLIGTMGDILLKKKKGYYFIASDLLTELSALDVFLESTD